MTDLDALIAEAEEWLQTMGASASYQEAARIIEAFKAELRLCVGREQQLREALEPILKRWAEGRIETDDPMALLNAERALAASSATPEGKR